MNKPYEWEGFLNDWGRQFHDVAQIFSYLDSYPHWKTMNGIRAQNTPALIDSAQKEWLWMLSKLDHPDDIEFLKPWWVPVDIYEYDLFLDLSDPLYPIFRTRFYDFIKPNWCQLILFSSVSGLMANIEDEPLITSQISKANEEHWHWMQENETESNGEDIEA